MKNAHRHIGSPWRGSAVLLAGLLLAGIASASASASVSPAVAAARPSEILRRYDHDVWRARDGLPGDQIPAIARTTDGYLWIGTDEGLARFDGQRFTPFGELARSALSVGGVASLLAGPDGSLWIGARSGRILLWKDGALSPVGPALGLKEPIRALCRSADGALWAGTAGAGVVRVFGGESRAVASANGLPDGGVVALQPAPDGGVWIATRRGLARWTHGSLSVFTRRDGLPDDQILSLGSDGAGGIWIGTIGGGLGRWTERGFEGLGGGDSDAALTALAAEEGGALWVGARGGGLTRYAGGGFESHLPRGVLMSDTVLALCVDSEHSVWVGTRGGGLHRFRPKTFATYDRDDGLPTNTVSAVLEDAAGDLWVGTRGNGSGDRGGLARLRRGVWTAYGIRDGLPAARVGSLFEDRKGTLWIGSAGGGLTKWENGRLVPVVPATDREPGNSGVLAIAQDRDGTLWWGTGRGTLWRLRDGRASAVRFADDGAPDRVFALLASADGTLWIGTSGGLFRRRGDSTRVFRRADGLPHDAVLAIHEDGAGILWIGTRGGLARLDGDRLASFRPREGLGDDAVFHVLEDAAGTLWLAGQSGVWRAARRELEDVAGGRARAVHAIHYGAADGIPDGACSGGSQPSAWRDREGRLWFATEGGVTVLDPSALVPAAPLAVHVDGVLADRRPLDPRRARVEPGTRLVSIHYAASSLLDPPSLRFRHRLEGFDRDWIDSGPDRTADYTNLPPGTYVFRVAVRAAPEGRWSEAAAPLALTVRPRYYQTTGFAALCAAAALTALWALHRIRLHQLRRRFGAVLEERARLARDVHDTLAQGFTAILLHLDSVSANLVRSPDAALHHLDRVRHTARRSLAEARRAVWDLRHRASERGSLAAALSEFASELQTASTRIDVRVRGPIRPLPEDVERELSSLAREAVTNAVHHARARMIRVAVRYARGAVHVVIRDDGRGFDPTVAPRGHFGLLGMRERTRRLRGRLRLRSHPGHGTVVSIRVPMGSEYSQLRRALAFPEAQRRPA